MGEGKEEGTGTLWALGDLEFLTQDAEPSGTTLVHAHNGLNELIQLAMMWTVQYHFPSGARFAFNFYRHSEQLLLRQTGNPSVTIQSKKGLTQGEPLSMVLYGITLIPLAEELRVADPGLLSPFHADNIAFNCSSRCSTQLL